MVNVAVVGVGFVGLTHAAVTAKFGHKVIGYDISKDKVNAFSSGNDEQIKQHIHEKGLSTIISEELYSGRLKFTSKIQEISDCDIFFMCLPTPYKPTGESDLSYLLNAAQDLTKILNEKNTFKLIVDKSTVPVGTASMLKKYLSEKGLTNFDVASNPEFLPEGNAVDHAIHSSKIIIGTENQKSRELLRKVYSNFCDRHNTTYLETNPETAEFIKYTSNSILYNQIIMWQAIVAPIAEKNSKINFEEVRKGTLADNRIASWGSYISAGAGGSCFKKDILSLAHQFETLNLDSSYLHKLDEINEHNKTNLIHRAEQDGNYSFTKKQITMLGVSFKQETNDIRESNALEMIRLLLDRDVAQIKVYDPLAIEQAKKYFNSATNEDYKKITYHTNIDLALENSDSAIIATDHQEFRTLKDKLIQPFLPIKKEFLLIDGRRMIPSFDVNDLLNIGVSYLPIAGTFQRAKN